MRNYKDENDGLDSFSKESIEKRMQDLHTEKELKIRWRREIESNPNIQNYLNSFNKESVDSFLTEYIRAKYRWHVYGDWYGETLEKERNLWIDLAYENLEAILQKKLFDAQCLWRAEQLKIKEVEICYDFEIWEENVFNCPFIEPITDEDFQLFHEFFSTTDPQTVIFNSYPAWQCYFAIKAGYLDLETNADIPEWYKFQYSKSGTSLLLLPDTRGEMERYYMRLNAQEKKGVPLKEPAKKRDSGNHISSYDEESKKNFVKNFECEEVQKQFKNYQEIYKKRVENNEFYEILREMINFDDTIAIEAHTDFKEAVKKAYYNYKRNKISEYLPIAYKQYLFNSQMGFSTTLKENKEASRTRKYYIEAILNGREINGEERTLIF